MTWPEAFAAVGSAVCVAAAFIALCYFATKEMERDD